MRLRYFRASSARAWRTARRSVSTCSGWRGTSTCSRPRPSRAARRALRAARARGRERALRVARWRALRPPPSAPTCSARARPPSRAAAAPARRRPTVHRARGAAAARAGAGARARSPSTPVDVLFSFETLSVNILRCKMTKYHLQINCLRLCLLLTVFIEQVINCDSPFVNGFILLSLKRNPWDYPLHII